MKAGQLCNSYCPSLPNNAVFVIDGVASAFMVATLCHGKSINCIFEVKKTPWREVDFVGMYEAVLDGVNITRCEIVNVENRYFLGLDPGPVRRLFLKLKHSRKVRKLVHIPRKSILVTTTNSSILHAFKFRRSYMLIDEGTSSLIDRSIRSQKSVQFYPRRFIVNLLKLLRIDKEIKNSNLTFTPDQSAKVGFRVDYRHFYSLSVEKHLSNTLCKFPANVRSILVLLAGQHHLSEKMISWDENRTRLYVEYNAQQIIRFLEQWPEFRCDKFLLKTHPFMGTKNPLLDRLPNLLKGSGISACSIFGDSEEGFLSSLPAEAFLSVGDFSAVLALDVSSTLWNVCHKQEVRCFMPYSDLLHFQHKYGPQQLNSLYEQQVALNALCGNKVEFF